MISRIFEIVAGSAISTVFLGFLLQTWIKARLEQSIRHEYDKKLEEFKFESRKREQSALVAELFSKWIKVADENSRELNKLSFEMSLWLPDEVAIEINKRLKNLNDARPVMNLLIECRKIIQGDSKMKPEDVTFFGVTK